MTEHIYQAKDAAPISLLKEAFGEAVTLTDQGEDNTYLIVSEFRLGENDYAVLQPDESEAEDEYMIFRIVRDETGALELETIDDDDEWEAIAEVYDEMSFEP